MDAGALDADVGAQLPGYPPGFTRMCLPTEWGGEWIGNRLKKRGKKRGKRSKAKKPNTLREGHGWYHDVLPSLSNRTRNSSSLASAHASKFSTQLCGTTTIRDNSILLFVWFHVYYVLLCCLWVKMYWFPMGLGLRWLLQWRFQLAGKGS